ncbi:unnamed protein product [Paramecium sonneborni]|uniref:Uncharacterized protein n=1 Tax=Paramecium sonneborni TaxID=65129 RepID=A0A8S1QG61_9CILI|nr:unnamed protein product [Paramecium sonneborni]
MDLEAVFKQAKQILIFFKVQEKVQICCKIMLYINHKKNDIVLKKVFINDLCKKRFNRMNSSSLQIEV